MSKASVAERNDPPRTKHSHTAAEWVTLILSTLLIAAVVGAVGFFSLTGGDQPPSFTTVTGAAEARAGRFYLPVTITNTGDEPAQEIRVRVELQSGETTESATFTIELLAAGASDEGTAIFSRDPAQGEIRAVVESFL